MFLFFVWVYGFYVSVFNVVEKILGGDLLVLLVCFILVGVFWCLFLIKVEMVKFFKYIEYINDFLVECVYVCLFVFFFEICFVIYYQFNGDFVLLFLFGEIVVLLVILGEFILLFLLVFGVLICFVVVGLLVMMLVIQVFVYFEVWWGMYVLWVVICFYFMFKGLGCLFFDYMLGNRFVLQV